MKKTVLFFIAIMTTFYSFSQIKSDKITPPQEGKSVVYFLRTKQLGFLMNFRYFDKGEYLGKFKGVNYLRYERDPGKTYLWIKAENIDLLEATLEPNKTYLVETNAAMGAFSASAKFKIIDFNDEKQIKRINSLLNEKDPVEIDENKRLSDKKEMKKILQKGMKKVRSKIKKKKFKVLSSDMYYKS